MEPMKRRQVYPAAFLIVSGAGLELLNLCYISSSQRDVLAFGLARAEHVLHCILFPVL